MATLLPEGKQSFTDGAGAPLVGGKLYTYDAGTSTPRATYADAAGTVPNTNPVILDARGEATVFWNGSYKVVLKTAADVTVWTVDGMATPEVAGSAANLAADIASSAPSKGAAIIGYRGRTALAALDTALTETTSVRPSWYIGTTDWAVNTQALIDAKAAAGGGKIYVPEGRYPTSQINLRPGVYLEGAGEEATEFYALGNAPVFAAIGTSGAVINRGGLSRMLVRGFGKANANAHGIYLAWANRMKFRDVRLHGTKYGVYFSNVWQLALDTVHADGAGADQNSIGFYGAEVDPTNQNNAVQAVNCMAQGVELYGFRLINFNGSKFVNCEATDGAHGWYLGDPTKGTEKIRWGHFTNCLADTNSSDGWRLEKGSALSFEQAQFSNCWAGTSGRHSWRVAGASQLIFSSPMSVASQQNAMLFVQSSRCVVSGAQLLGYDAAAGGNAGIALVDSQYIGVGGASHIYSTSATAKAVVEYGSSDFNTVIGNHLQNGFTKLGAASRFIRNQGAYGERSGSVAIGSGATSAIVTHGMGYTPVLDDITLTLRDNLGAASKAWVSGVTATTFQVNLNTAPGATVTVGWAVDPLGQ